MNRLPVPVYGIVKLSVRTPDSLMSVVISGGLNDTASAAPLIPNSEPNPVNILALGVSAIPETGIVP